MCGWSPYPRRVTLPVFVTSGSIRIYGGWFLIK